MRSQEIKQRLPASVLGDDRCVQIEYFGHGDIFVASWRGDVNRNVEVDEEEALCFNLAHGSDVMIFASLAGYLHRSGFGEDKIKALLLEAGDDLMRNFDVGQYHHSLNQRYINDISRGRPFPRQDIPSHQLACLAHVVPTRPDPVSKVGGTGIFTRQTQDGRLNWVIASVVDSENHDNSECYEVRYTADFCVQDVPILARLICNMALGEYKKDLQHFIAKLYVPEASRFDN